ncbi:MAG: hypothetical protein P8Y78_07700 [Acidihalobacter sp.]
MEFPDVLVGIDDTDNLTSRGTGYRARQLGQRLHEAALGEIVGITRHQLLVHPAVPYTSHNSSACLRLRPLDSELETLQAFCRDFLLRESAPGSDAGLCVATVSQIDSEVERLGRMAKEEVLEQGTARELAADKGVFLEGLTGDHGGVIGALAATGLHKSGNDGRYLWLPGLREAAGTSLGVEAIKRAFGIGEIRSLDERVTVPDSAVIDLGEWPRPVLLDGIPVLLVKGGDDHEHTRFQVADRDYIKRHY